MTKEMRTIQLEVPSTLGYERVVMDAAAAAAKIMGFHRSRIDDLRTAVAEACINAIEHGHKFNSAMMVVVAMTIDDDMLQIDVVDQGKGPSEAVETPDIEKKIAGEQRPRGWGMFLIRSLMDEVRFNVRSEMGNVTRLIIRLEPNPAPEEGENRPVEA